MYKKENINFLKTILEILSDILARISRNDCCVAVALHIDKTLDNKYRLKNVLHVLKKQLAALETRCLIYFIMLHILILMLYFQKV